MAKNLTHGCHNTFLLRPDTETILRPDGPGRDSVRLRSKRAYTNHVAVYVPRPCSSLSFSPF